MEYIFSIEFYKEPTKEQLEADVKLEEFGLEPYSVGLGSAEWITTDKEKARKAREYLKNNAKVNSTETKEKEQG